MFGLNKIETRNCSM